MLEDDRCVLCGNEVETIDHLFFSCPFAFTIWKEVMHLCNTYKGVYPWRVEPPWLCVHMIQEDFAGYVQRLALAATIYFIWQVRNMKIFKKQNWRTEQVLQQIKFDVRAAVSGKHGIQSARKTGN